MDNIGHQIIKESTLLMEQLHAQPNGSMLAPAAFWQRFGQYIVSELQISGFANFKRLSNYLFFQSWVISQSNPQIQHVYRQLQSHHVQPWDVTRVTRHPSDIPLQYNVPPPSETEINTLHAYTTWIWQLGSYLDALGLLTAIREPSVGTPLPFYLGERLISQDLANSAIEINAIHAMLRGHPLRHVLEIGSGYGRTASLFRQYAPHTMYCLCDIPPALPLAQHYLQHVYGADCVQTVSRAMVPPTPPATYSCYLPHQLQQFPDTFFDLVINISSFDEMSAEQVQYYFAEIDRTCQGFLFLRGHKRAPHFCNISGGGVHTWVRPAHWRLVEERPDPVIPDMALQLWKIH